jgi:Pyruvate/2-oxoacid:ferredoxin oxidoreductase gamma subunit
VSVGKASQLANPLALAAVFRAALIPESLLSVGLRMAFAFNESMSYDAVAVGVNRGRITDFPCEHRLASH